MIEERDKDVAVIMLCNVYNRVTYEFNNCEESLQNMLLYKLPWVLPDEKFSRHLDHRL